MTDLQAHHDRCAVIAKGHWRRFESDSEHAERVEAAEAEAGRFFGMATTGQKAIHDRTMADLAGLSAPRYDRARGAAKAVWYATTADARALFETSFEELMRAGQISESTLEAWNALPDFVDLREVA